MQQFNEENGNSETEEKITDDNGPTNWCDCAGVTDDEGNGDSETEEKITDDGVGSGRAFCPKGGIFRLR